MTNPAIREERRARLMLEQAEQALVRRVVTPEGAVIHLRLASFAARCGAFLIDVSIQWAITIAFVIALSNIASTLNYEALNFSFAIYMIFQFFLRNFYYIFFEAGRRGATPGKRALGLRVVSRDGGRLTADAVLARNFIREIEVGLPVMFLFTLMFASGDTASAAIGWLGLLWAGVFAFFPLFNRDRMRVGDLIAGTWVIVTPKLRLLGDIVETASKAPESARFVFTTEQTDAYGIHELHVLEDVLRSSTPQIKAEVAERISQKIGWQPQSGDTHQAFLEAYYAALRRRLEQRMLLGHRKEDKYDQR